MVYVFRIFAPFFPFLREIRVSYDFGVICQHACQQRRGKGGKGANIEVKRGQKKKKKRERGGRSTDNMRKKVIFGQSCKKGRDILFGVFLWEKGISKGFLAARRKERGKEDERLLSSSL